MPLFLDGARLGYGLAAEGTDVTLADLARLTDVFYIGGTKVGALCGGLQLLRGEVQFQKAKGGKGRVLVKMQDVYKRQG